MLSAGFMFSDVEICQLPVQAVIGQLTARREQKMRTRRLGCESRGAYICRRAQTPGYGRRNQD